MKPLRNWTALVAWAEANEMRADSQSPAGHSPWARLWARNEDPREEEVLVIRYGRDEQVARAALLRAVNAIRGASK